VWIGDYRTFTGPQSVVVRREISLERRLSGWCGAQHACVCSRLQPPDAEVYPLGDVASAPARVAFVMVACRPVRNDRKLLTLRIASCPHCPDARVTFIGAGLHGLATAVHLAHNRTLSGFPMLEFKRQRCADDLR